MLKLFLVIRAGLNKARCSCFFALGVIHILRGHFLKDFDPSPPPRSQTWIFLDHTDLCNLKSLTVSSLQRVTEKAEN